MAKVFVSGSMKIKRLDPLVVDRLNNIVANDLCIIVGDADGVDTSVQNYLKERDVHLVVVYCTGETPRHNLGDWPTKKVSSSSKPGTREYFATKDLKMADDCDYGLMIWDAKSTGTLNNAIELLKRGKSALVFVNKIKDFVKIKKIADLDHLLTFMTNDARRKADERIQLTRKLSSLRHTQGQLFGA